MRQMPCCFPVFAVLAVLVGLFLPGLSPAQDSTTGAMAGKVMTTDGHPIVGAVITVKTAQGDRVTGTGPDGQFLIPFLLPGNYTVEVRAPGFAAIAQHDVEISLGLRRQLEYNLLPELTEEITVVAQTPLVDRSTTSIGANLKIDAISANTPVGRAYSDLFFVAPGVTGAGAGGSAGSTLTGNPSVGGSSGLENSYIIDGVNATNTGYGGIGTFNVNYGSLGTGVTTDFLDEVQIKTGGFEAEYGQATGGILNAIVRSGTNDFKGQVSVYFTPGSIEGTRKVSNLTPTDANIVEQETLDFGFSVGGPIVKDKFFYFLAYNPVFNDADVLATFAPPGTAADIVSTSPVVRERRSDNYAAKLTWLPHANHRFELTAFGDPFEGEEGPQRDSALLTPAVTGPARFSAIDYGADNYSLKYQGVISPHFFIEGQISRHEGKFIESGTGTAARNILNLQVPGGLPTGGLGFIANQDDVNTQYSVKLTNVVGKHELRYGASYDDIEYTEERLHSGPSYTAQIPVFDETTGDWTGTYLPVQSSTGASVERRECDLVLDTDCDDFDSDLIGDVFRVVRTLLSSPEAVTTTEETNFFFQDTWSISQYFTLRYGVRHTIQEINGSGNFTLPFSRSGSSGIVPTPSTFEPSSYRFSGNTAPRIGFTWDVAHNGKSKLYANFGRYYQRVPNDLAVRSFSNEVGISREEFKDPDLTIRREADSCITDSVTDPNNPVTANCHTVRLQGLSPTRVEASTKLPYVDEYLLGYAYEVTPNSSLETRLIFREEGRVLEDVQFGTLEAIQNYYYGTNYGFAVDPFPGFGAEPFGEYVLANPGDNTPANLPPARRDYSAWEIIYNKRMSDRWQLLAHYRYSRLVGNYEGLFRNDNGQSDPNITSLYDFPNSPLMAGQFLEGRLNLDTPHILRLYGAVQFPHNITLGGAFNAASGVPRFPLLAHPSYQNAGEIPGMNPIYFDVIDPSDSSVAATILQDYTPVERGFFGRTAAIVTMDLHFDWRPPLKRDTQFRLAVDVFNILNQQEATALSDNVELTTAVLDPNFLSPLFYQAPRRVRLSAAWTF